jgi:hypothetical protein
MTDNCQYLPERKEISQYNGSWPDYVNALYAIFKHDLINNDVIFDGKRVDIIHQEIFDGKEKSFWHIVSEAVSKGDTDNDRIPNLERASRVPWIRPMIQGGDCEHYFKYDLWHDKTNKIRTHIFCEETGFIVIIEDRGKYYKLITAFLLDEKMLQKELKRYKRYKNENAHPKVDEISHQPTQKDR